MDDMNVDGLILLGTISAGMLAGVIWIGLEMRRSARRLEQTHKSHSTEMSELRAEMDELRNAVTALQAQVSDSRPAAPQAERFLTAEQRAHALSMLRSGAGTDTVRTTLRLPWAETTLLQRVEKMLATTASGK
jgi:type II secretory pathway component PulM